MERFGQLIPDNIGRARSEAPVRYGKFFRLSRFSCSDTYTYMYTYTCLMLANATRYVSVMEPHHSSNPVNVNGRLLSGDDPYGNFFRFPKFSCCDTYTCTYTCTCLNPTFQKAYALVMEPHDGTFPVNVNGFQISEREPFANFFRHFEIFLIWPLTLTLTGLHRNPILPMPKSCQCRNGPKT